MIGWEGESCDQCIRNPDCSNGYCYEPWQCICQGDWTGLNCNIGKTKYCIDNYINKNQKLKRSLSNICAVTFVAHLGQFTFI